MCVVLISVVVQQTFSRLTFIEYRTESLPKDENGDLIPPYNLIRLKPVVGRARKARQRRQSTVKQPPAPPAPEDPGTAPQHPQARENMVRRKKLPWEPDSIESLQVGNRVSFVSFRF